MQRTIKLKQAQHNMEIYEFFSISLCKVCQKFCNSINWHLLIFSNKTFRVQIQHSRFNYQITLKTIKIVYVLWPLMYVGIEAYDNKYLEM